MNGLIPVEYDETEIKTYANDLRAVYGYHNVTLTAYRYSANLSIYYNGLSFMLGQSGATLAAATYNCTVTMDSYVYVPLAYISTTDLANAFYFSDQTTSISLGYVSISSALYSYTLVRNATGGSTWYLVCSKYRVASSATTKKVTLESTEYVYWLGSARLNAYYHLPTPIS